MKKYLKVILISQSVFLLHTLEEADLLQGINTVKKLILKSYSTEDEGESLKADVRLSALFTKHQLHFHPSHSCIFSRGAPWGLQTVIMQQSLVFQSRKNLQPKQEHSYRVCSSNVLKRRVWTTISPSTADVKGLSRTLCRGSMNALDAESPSVVVMCVRI